jgi:hypothetical protein
MVRFNPSIGFAVLTVVNGCSAHLQSPQEQKPRAVEQQEEKSPPLVPTFRYRPGAGLNDRGAIELTSLKKTQWVVTETQVMRVTGG